MTYAEAVTEFRRSFDVEASNAVDTADAWSAYLERLIFVSRISMQQWDTWDPPRAKRTAAPPAPEEKPKRPSCRARPLRPPLSLTMGGLTWDRTPGAPEGQRLYAPPIDSTTLRMRAGWGLVELRAGLFEPLVTVWVDWLPAGVTVTASASGPAAAWAALAGRVNKHTPNLVAVMNHALMQRIPAPDAYPA